MASGQKACVDFVGRPSRGEYPNAKSAQLEALLHWLAGRTNDPAKAIEFAFQAHGLSPEAAQRRTLLYLDYALFSHEADPYRLFGLTPDCNKAAIRARHKHLLQILHPDRHATDKAWFTDRSERVNRAYSYLKIHHGQSQPATRTAKAAPGMKPVSNTPSPTPRAPRRWRAFVVSKARLRQQLKTHLGSPASLERRLYVVLFITPAIVLVIVYVSLDSIGTKNGSARPALATESPEPATEAKRKVDTGITSEKEPIASTTSTATLESPAPVHSAMPAAGDDEQSNSDFAMIQMLLANYREAYNRADIDRLSNLFWLDATTGNARGRAEITEEYKTYFSQTQNRNLVLGVVRFERTRHSELRVNTRYILEVTYTNGETRTDAGQFELWLMEREERLKIQHISF